MSDATLILAEIEAGDAEAPGRLLAMVYDELRLLAARKMAQEPPGHTLQPTALVHEAWLRLVNAEGRKFANQAHFFAAAGEAMRRILIDRARRRQAERHGGKQERVEFVEGHLVAPAEDELLLAVDDALEKLAREHPAQAQVVKLRFHCGMTNEETAQALNVSVATVKNYWVFARAWLFDAVRGQ